MRIELICAVTAACFAQVALATSDRSADAFPYELAFARNEFRVEDDPVVSPDGSRVAYAVVSPPDVRTPSIRFLTNGTPISAIGAALHVSPSKERAQADRQPICGGRGNQWNPSWSPDGSLLGFYSDAEGSVHLWTYSVADGACKRISDAAIRASLFRGYQARWSADGRTMYVPVRPDPPLEMPDTVDPTQGIAQQPDKDGIVPPLIFSSGSEAPATKAARNPTADVESDFMLGQYNSTFVAIDVDSGAARTLADARLEPRPGTMKMSPSGRWLSYESVAYRNEKISTSLVKDLAFVPAAGGAPVVAARGLVASKFAVNYSEMDYRWHERDDRLVYLLDKRAWLVEFNEAGTQPAKTLAGELGDVVAPVLYFTRDGTSVIVGIEPEDDGRIQRPRALAIVPLDGGKARRLQIPDPAKWQFMDLVRAGEDTAWQPDGRHLHVLMRERSTAHQAVYRIDLSSGQLQLITSGLFKLRTVGAGRDHRQLYAMYEDIATPPDLHRYEQGMSRRSRVSMIEPRVDAIRLGSAEVIETRVPVHDGKLQNVRTALLLPHGAKRGDRMPAIVMIYSGSDLSTLAAQYGGGMGNTVPSQIFTSRGYAVVMANVVLSPEGKPGNPLQDMVDVLLPQLHALANAGYIDMERLAISGQSFGGYSTAAIVSQTNLFRAGIPVNGLFDVASFYSGMDRQGGNYPIHWAEHGQGRMGETPWDNPLRYIDNSPFYRIDRINTPLLIVAGEKDITVPHEESKRLFSGLRRLERPAQLVLYPLGGHSISDWSTPSAADAARRMVEFLDKHLGSP